MMKAAVAIEPEIVPLDTRVGRATLTDAIVAHTPVSRTRAADYLELTKPRIAGMALFTVGVGYLLGAGSNMQAAVLFHTLVGAGLVAAGGSALNQLLERNIDKKMFRTCKRPLPAGRLTATDALVFGISLSVLGLVYLFLMVPYPAGIAAAVTLVSYVAIYTPLKTITVWNTVVGAVPGALPPVIGWCAASGWESPAGGLALFLILFLWQLPHFFAIAWMYREDYARGGFRMLPITDPSGKLTAVAMISTCLALLVSGLVPTLIGMAGPLSVVGAIVFGGLFLWPTIPFARNRTDRQARKILRASLLYLPGVLGLILIDALLLRAW